jgi:hypothetical protein
MSAYKINGKSAFNTDKKLYCDTIPEYLENSQNLLINTKKANEKILP